MRETAYYIRYDKKYKILPHVRINLMLKCTNKQEIRTYEKSIRMGTKLTLSINEEVIASAKKYAKDSGRSSSELVEFYLEIITMHHHKAGDAELDKIFGIINLQDDFDEKAAIREIRRKKQGLPWRCI